MPVTVTVPDTTLVCIDCQYPQLAARAIRLSLAQCSYQSVKLLTDDSRIASDLDPRVELVRIPRIRSVDDYSRFIIKDLLHHVNTDFVQIVQWDGYVINGRAWSDAFLQYDYIGARWWFLGDGRNVGNGGFSLRSRRLLQALQDPEIQVDGPEDIAICRTYRDVLERRYGIRFAPAIVADRYSFEGILPTLTEFGFHRIFNFPFLYDEAVLAEVLAAIPDADFCSDTTVSLIEILVLLKRKKEALRYAQRMRQNDRHFAGISPDFRTLFEKLSAGLNAKFSS